jgi:hypothetical protein
MGANVFGFLQRAGSLYGTGMSRNCRCIGACKETAAALNRVLGKNFVLAQADDSFVKLTNMESVESIEKSLDGYDAVILGNSLVVESRPVTSGTFETGPNSKTLEVFWDTVRGKEMSENPETVPQANQIIDNTLEACRRAGVKTIVGVATAGGNFDSFSAAIQSCGIPHTLIQCQDSLIKFPDYTYRKGVQANLELSSSPSGDVGQTCREDLAALSVACLQQLDWAQSRTISVVSKGPLVTSEPPAKRPDQDWCVNSDILAAKLIAFQGSKAPRF